MMLIGLSVVAMSYQTLLLNGISQILPQYFFFIFSLTIFAYYFQKNEPYVKITSYIFAAISLALLLTFSKEIILRLLMLFLIGSFYYFLPEKHSIRMKTYLKPVFIAFIWVFITVKIPLLFFDTASFETGTNKILFISFERFFFFFASALAYDIIDISADTKSGLMTIPRRYGKHTATIMIVLSISMAIIFSSVNFFFHNIAIYQYIALIFSFLVAGIVLPFAVNSKNSESGKLITDSILILQFLCIFFVSILFS